MLKEYLSLQNTQKKYLQFRLLLVTSGPGVPITQRYRKPKTQAYRENQHSLFINNLYNKQQDQGEGITSFFVRKSVYLAFFERPVITPVYSNNQPPTPRHIKKDLNRIFEFNKQGEAGNQNKAQLHNAEEEALEQTKETRDFNSIENYLDRQEKATLEQQQQEVQECKRKEELEKKSKNILKRLI